MAVEVKLVTVARNADEPTYFFLRGECGHSIDADATLMEVARGRGTIFCWKCADNQSRCALTGTTDPCDCCDY